MNNIIIGENAYVATIGKGLKERSIEGRFRRVRIVLLAEDEDEGGDRIRETDVYSFLNSHQGTFGASRGAL